MLDKVWIAHHPRMILPKMMARSNSEGRDGIRAVNQVVGCEGPDVVDHVVLQLLAGEGQYIKQHTYG